MLLRHLRRQRIDKRRSFFDDPVITRADMLKYLSSMKHIFSVHLELRARLDEQGGVLREEDLFRPFAQIHNRSGTFRLTILRHADLRVIHKAFSVDTSVLFVKH
jgi:hypothetical protein